MHPKSSCLYLVHEYPGKVSNLSNLIFINFKKIWNTFENFLHSMSMFSTSISFHAVVFHSSIEVLQKQIMLTCISLNTMYMKENSSTNNQFPVPPSLFSYNQQRTTFFVQYAYAGCCPSLYNNKALSDIYRKTQYWIITWKVFVNPSEHPLCPCNMSYIPSWLDIYRCLFLSRILFIYLEGSINIFTITCVMLQWYEPNKQKEEPNKQKEKLASFSK